MILAHVIWLAFACCSEDSFTAVTSIGAAMVAMPLITFIASPKEGHSHRCISSGVAPLALSIIYRRYILWKEMIWLSLGCIVAFPQASPCSPCSPAPCSCSP